MPRKKKNTIEKTMEKFKKGKLKSGGSKKKVTNPKQAIAIAISEKKKGGCGSK